MTRAVEPVIGELREMVLRMGSRAEAILDKAVQAVIDRNGELARQVERDDLEIDRLDVEIDGAVLRALALQAPVASDLRRVIAVKMMATDLERVGDLARNIAKSALRLSLHPELPLPLALARLARSAQRMLHGALDAYAHDDAEAARGVLAQDEEVDRQQDEVVRCGLQSISGRPELASQGVDIIFVAKHLERVGDHATNIAEDVILVIEARNVKHASKLGA
jgi:phosphate transport system protein